MRLTLTVRKEKLYETVRDIANKLLLYNAEDKIDDFNVYEWNEDPEHKIIKVMSPVGQELYFRVEPLSDTHYYIYLLLDTWRDR
mgnify:CR=1 FL=1